MSWRPAAHYVGEALPTACPYLTYVVGIGWALSAGRLEAAATGSPADG